MVAGDVFRTDRKREVLSNARKHLVHGNVDPEDLHAAGPSPDGLDDFRAFKIVDDLSKEGFREAQGFRGFLYSDDGPVLEKKPDEQERVFPFRGNFKHGRKWI